MKTAINNKFLPKITLILRKVNEKRYIRPSIRKTQFFLKNKAKHYLKNGNFITIRVVYADGSQNVGTYYQVDDLNWAFIAFVKDYLK